VSWTVRHAGSPQSVSGLTSAAVRSGLADGRWETTDEVRPDSGGEWEALETHRDFAETAAAVNPPPRHEPEDESRLDMNPLIDVSLVLLIFFILTTTYETIRKVLDMPGATKSSANAKTTADKLKEVVIRVEARSLGGRPVFKIENEVIAPDQLFAKLNEYSRSSGKKQVLLDAQGVDWGTVVQIMDAARAAGIEKTLLQKKPEPTPAVPKERS